MKITKTTFFFIFSLFSTIIIAQGIEFQPSWEGTISKAKEENKLIFLDAYTVWCGPCKKMDRDVFSQKMIGDFFNKNFINIKLDMEKGIGKTLANQYNVKAFPTLLFLSFDGTMIHRVAGFHDPEEMLTLGKTVLDPENNLSAMEKRFANGDRDPKFLMEYSKIRFDIADKSHIPIVDAYLKTQEDWKSEDNLKFIFDYATDSKSEAFPFLVRNKPLFYPYFEKRMVDQRVNQLVYDKIYNENDDLSLERIEGIMKAAFPENADLLFANFKMSYYRQAGDRQNYALAALNRFAQIPCKDAGELNDAAYTFYRVIDNEKMLKKATKWAKKSIKISNEYANNDTLASLYYKLNNKSKANKYAKRAIDIAKEDGDDFSKTQELLEKIRQLD